MHRLEPVVWTKGTFLNPQHLQLQDRFLEEMLRFQLQALEFRPWGFRRLRIDQAALAGGTFAITEASGILPDGLLFDIPESDAARSFRSGCYERGHPPVDSELPGARLQRGQSAAGCADALSGGSRDAARR